MESVREIVQEVRQVLEGRLGRSDPLEHVGIAPLLLMRHDPDAAASLAHDMLQVHPPAAVPLCWRRCYEEAQLFAITRVPDEAAAVADLDEHTRAELCLSAVVRRLDLALIKSGAPGRAAMIHAILAALQPAASLLDDAGAGLGCASPARSADIHASSQASAAASPGLFHSSFALSDLRVPELLDHQVVRLDRPSLSSFQQHWRDVNSPAVLTNTLPHWAALSAWTNAGHWLDSTLGGRRLVPIEIGSSYTDNDWTQRLMPFREYLEDYLLPTNRYCCDSNGNLEPKPKGYLAQHNLLEQIPALHNDIAIPDFCWIQEPAACSQPASGAPARESTSDASCGPTHSLADAAAASGERDPQRVGASRSGRASPTESSSCVSAEGLAAPSINIWLGPEGTVSPAHTDPHHNILAQVVGRKYVRLFAPEQGSCLYPMSGGKGGISSHADHDADEQRCKSPDGEPSSTRLKTDADDDGEVVDMSNTSQVDVGLEVDWLLAGSGSADDRKSEQSRKQQKQRRAEQAARFPLLGQAQYAETVLHPGECLFIPRGWWHYITSLDTSCSVSFWWD